MRTTQYIGMTQKAKDFIDTMIDLHQIMERSLWPMTLGMFGEIVEGEYYLFVTQSGVTIEIKEVEQCSPWSSGPMIFTYLQVSVDGMVKRLFEWIKDNTIDGYDFASGRYWI